MRLKTILTAIALIMVGLVVVVYTVAKSIDFNAYKDAVAQQVKVATGRDFTIAGNVSVDIGLVPHLTASQITLHNADWSDQPQMVSIDRLDAEVELLPLLFDQIRIREVVLSGGSLILERNTQGVGNWSFNGAAVNGGGSSSLPQVGRLKFENIRLRYRDPAHQLDRVLQIDHFTTKAASVGGAISWSMSGASEKNVIDLRGSIGSIDQMAAGRFPIDLSGKIGDVALQSHATIGNLATLSGLDIDLEANGSDLAKLNTLLGSTLPSTPAFKVAGHLSDLDKGYHLDHLAVIFGQSAVTGEVTAFVDRASPLVQATLSSDHFDLADIGLASAETKAATKPTTGRLFSLDPWRFDDLNRFEADIKITIGELLRGHSILKNGVASIKVDHGTLSVPSFSATIDQGQIDAAATLQTGDKPVLDIQMKGANIASAPVLTAAGLSDVLTAGAVNMVMAIKGPATSEHDLMAGLSGMFQFNTGSGTLRSSFAQFLFADLTKVVTFGGSGEAAKVNCLAGRFDIEHGVAKTRNLVMDTPGVDVLGSGVINLGTETLNMRIDSKSKQVSLAALTVPLIVSGGLQHPTVVPDAAGALLNTGDFVASTANTVTFGALNNLTGLGGSSGIANACASVTGVGAAPTSGGEKIKQGATAIGNGTKQILQGVGESAGSAAKDVGNGIKSGLKSIFGN